MSDLNKEIERIKKEIKRYSFKQITDVRPDGFEGNNKNQKRIVQRDCIFVYHLEEIFDKIIGDGK